MNILRLISLITLCFVFVSMQTGFAQERCTPPPTGVFDYGMELNTNATPPSIAKTMAQWSSATKLPIPKKYHTVASYNGEVYVFAGVTSGNIYNTKCFKYNPLTDSWKTIADFPLQKFLCGQAQTIGGKIYIFSGIEDFGTKYKSISTVYEYNPVTDKYIEKAPMLISQSLTASGVIDGKIYVISGNGATTSDFITTVQVYDPVADDWSTATDYPIKVRYLSAASVNNKIIVTGGYNQIYPSWYVANTYIGEINSGILTWTKVRDYPIGAIIFPCGVGIGDNAYFFGGRPTIDNNKPATQRSFRYIPATNVWETLPMKITGVEANNQAGTDGKRIIAAGGEDSSAAAVALDVNEIFDPVAQAAPLLVLTDTTVFAFTKRGTPVADQFTMKNNGAASLTWSASITPANNWVTLSKTSGTLSSMGATVLNFTFKSDSISSGVYTANMILTTNDQSHQTTTVPIYFSLQDQALDTDINILLEEGTGTWCGFCPYGGDSVKAIVARNAEKVIAISYHGGSTTEPMLTPYTDPWTKLVGLTGWPGASANRTAFSGESGLMLGNREKWSPRVEQLLTTKRSPITLRVVDGGCNPTTKGGWMTIEIFFHQPVSSDVRLSIVQVEDGFNWKQTFYPQSGPTQYLYPYFHENVVRQVIPTGVSGEPIESGNIFASQSTITKTVFFTSKDSVWDKSRFVIFVHIAGGEVLQTIEQELSLLSDAKNPVVVNDYSLSQNYPNPFNPSTAITFSLPRTDHVTLKVTDMLGREVQTIVNENQDAGTHTAVFDGNKLSSGVYNYTIKAGSFTQTKRMVLTK